MASPSDFPKNTLIKLLDVIGALNECTTRHQLKQAFQLHFFPLFDCNAALYGWLDSQLTKLDTMDSIGLSDKDLNTLNKFVYHDPATRKLFKYKEKVIAYDVDMPRKLFLKKAELFFEKNPNEKRRSHPFFRKFQTGIIMRDPVGTFGIGLHRLKPNDRKFVPKDVVLFELLIPHITSTIKSLLLSDENFEYENLTTLISNRLYPVALVTKSGKVSFCNDAFTKVFKVTKKENLPLRLFREFSFESEKFEKPHDMKTPLDGKKIELPEGIFILQLSLIDGKHSKTENRYFLELNPLIESGSDFERALKSKNLGRTKRLVCALVRDGKSNQEIADILGQTIHSANRHLKELNKIFNAQSNRNKLISILNQF